MSRKTGDRPNVIFFFTDQQRWDTAGVHGNPLDLTPNFDRVAGEGTHLYHTFTCQPVCAPARSSLQTGRYATGTGVFCNGIGMRPDERTIARCFNDAGYHTGYIGKWHLAGHPHVGPVPEERRGGYQYWLGSDILEFTSEPYRTVMYDGDGKPVRLPGYRIDALTDAAIRYVDAHQDEPFFLTVSYLEPHHQNHVDDYPPPDGYRERYTGRWMPPDLQALGGSSAKHLGGYFGLVKRLDEAFGRLLDALKSLDLLDNTIVLYTSDHGNHFRTRNAEYKRSCHESSVRVPALLTGPGFRGGGQVRDLVSLVDLPPTLLEAARLDVPEQMQGRSVMPLVRRQPVEWPDDIFIQISEAQVGRAVRTRRWKYSVVAPDMDPNADMGSDRYQEECLYDLESDPYELSNLIQMESHRPVAAVMRERLLRRMVEAGEAAPEIVEAEVRPSGQRRVSEAEVQE